MNQAVQKRGAQAPIATKAGARELLDGMKGRIAQVLGKHVDSDRFVGVILNSFSKTPGLYDCTMESVGKCVLASAELNLWPDTPMAYCHLIPYRDNKAGTVVCTWIPGYRGLLELINRAQTIKGIWCYTVHEGDKFSHVLGSDPRIIHEPAPEDERGKMTHVYAVAQNMHDVKIHEIMTAAEVEKIRGNKKYGPWVDHPLEMARKTVLRRISKKLPMSAEFRKAEELDNDQWDDLKQADYRVTGDGVRKLATPEQLKENLRLQAEMLANGRADEQPQEPAESTAREPGDDSEEAWNEGAA